MDTLAYMGKENDGNNGNINNSPFMMLIGCDGVGEINRIVIISLAAH